MLKVEMVKVNMLFCDYFQRVGCQVFGGPTHRNKSIKISPDRNRNEVIASEGYHRRGLFNSHEVIHKKSQVQQLCRFEFSKSTK